ncbi:MAG: hypothetical protein EU543_00810 [Promethearchaeota archaeon]|nr:MAG: hypothetical protein EU543_00810 [Candidatus Lokiarchaeota archaeon]
MINIFTKQIHLVFNSREKDRITKPILDHPPNKLYYFTAYIRDTGQKDQNLSYLEQNIELLKNKLPQLEIIQKEVDYANYIEVIQEISKIIKDEREENPNCEIYINVGSGSKLTGIASVEAAKLWDCDIYYVYSTDYNPSGEGPEHKGEMILIEPLTFPLKKPKELYIKILKLIDKLIQERYKGKDYNEKKKKFIYKKDLVEQLYKEKVLTLQNKNKDERKLKASKYMNSKKYLNRLNSELNYINVSDHKRNKKIYLTKEGKEVLQIFRYHF